MSSFDKELAPAGDGKAAETLRREPVGVGLHRFLGSVPTVVLWGLVLLWSLPTIGILVTSFRPSAATRETGWWTELPDVWPDQFGRGVLMAALIAVGVSLLLIAIVDQRRIEERAAAVVGAVAVVGGAAWLYPDLFSVRSLVLGVAILGVVAALAGVLWLLARLFDRLSRPWRIVFGVVVVGVIVGLFLFSTSDLTLDNYDAVFAPPTAGDSDAPDMGKFFLNTLAITLPATIIPIAIAAFAAYAFAWMDFPGRHWLFVAVVAMLAVPFQMSLIPLLQLYNGGAHLTIFGETVTVFPDLDLAGTTTAVWLTHIGFGLPLAVFLLHNYIASLPRDLFEAARIDGADHPTIFWRLVLPLAVPALAAFAIFQFLWVWNDFLVARTFLGSGSDLAPMTIRLNSLKGSRGQSWHLLTAAAFVTIAVPLGVFFSLQRYFVRGMLAGSVKG